MDTQFSGASDLAAVHQILRRTLPTTKDTKVGCSHLSLTVKSKYTK